MRDIQYLLLFASFSWNEEQKRCSQQLFANRVNGDSVSRFSNQSQA